MKRLLAAAVTIAFAAPALAQAPYSPPPAAPAQPVAAPAEPPVQLVLTFGADFGSKKLFDDVVMSDGSTRSLKANQGVNASVGMAFLKLAEGRFATQATIGVEYSAIEASNGSIRWLAFPLEVMEVAYLDPVRLGAGLSYLLSPNVKGDGAAEGFEIEYESSPGLVLQADYVWRLPRNPRGGRVTLGARYVAQKLEPSDGRASIDANAFGFVLGYTG